MCRFASFVLTKDKAFWLENVDSHELIIEHHYLSHLDGVECGIVRVEILPSDTPDDMSTWKCVLDQDQLPDWTFRGDPNLEQRTRKALAKRAKAEKWFVQETGQNVHVGYRGTATAGFKGTATAGNYGIATAGEDGKSTVGDYGTATAGDYGTATVGYKGTATAGYKGTATAGEGGTATAGYRGTATAGYRGTATAGDGGTIQIVWYDGTRERIAVGYVGEDGIEPDVPYRVKGGRLVRAK